MGKYHWFPYSLLSGSFKVLNAYLKPTRHHHFFPMQYDKVGANIYKPDEMAPGLTLLTSYWKDLNWKPGIRLINAKGDVLHQWITDPAAIWPVSPHSDDVADAFNVSTNYVHGAYLFENGDIIFNIEYMGLVRMNACNEIIWRLSYRTHHSIFRTETGDFWVSGLKWIEDTPEGRERLTRYPGLRLPVAEEFALKVSPDGEILQEISLLETLYKAGHEYLIWKIGRRRKGDITHLNEIEVLSSSMADHYPLFEPGDLVVSMRNIHAVFVFDPVSLKVKWLTTGPFMFQHDPDFIGNGWIAIFDNNPDGSRSPKYLDANPIVTVKPGQYLGGSRIVALKPGTNEVRVLFPKGLSQPFYTEAGGKFQMLENGNLLIAEAQAGRLFETNSSGQIVWEWIQEYNNDNLVPEVLEASRYNLTSTKISSWGCN